MTVPYTNVSVHILTIHMAVRDICDERQTCVSFYYRCFCLKYCARCNDKLRRKVLVCLHLHREQNIEVQVLNP